MSEIEKNEIMCAKCGIPLIPKKTDMTYQKQTMAASLLKCPQCGQVFIPENLVKGKMFEIEKALEEK